MSSPLLQISNLRVSAIRPEGDLDLVVDASLRAAKGEIVGIVGESGSGKTMTLRSIIDLLPAGVTVTDGEILLQGESLLQASESDLRRVRGGMVGMVFQEPMTALDPTMRVGMQVAESARIHLGLSRAAAQQRAIELLGQVGLPDAGECAERYPHQLSGGMQQRVMVAIALAGEPALLLCDEPTTALDATITLQVLDLLAELTRSLDVGAVIVTHDLGVVARICDRVTVMYAGRVVEEGACADVIQRPRHPYTLSLLRAVPTRESTVDDLEPMPGAPPEPGARPSGCPFAPRCALAEPACEAAIELVELPGERFTACRRHEVLSLEGARADA